MAPSRRRLAAFTLIELLVVIAIIAILTAILLPVFATVREGSRQGVAISNMHDIQSKMEQFKLDNHKYPDVLFGYYYPNSTMATGLGMAQADDKTNNTNKAAIYFPGLYPAYIKDPNVFTDPNNNFKTSDSVAASPTPALTDAYVIAPCNPTNDNLLRGGSSGPGSGSTCTTATSGQAVPTLRTFYKADAYDSSLKVDGGNTLDAATFITRYQTAREALNSPDADYNRQLRWRNPPADTVVTLTPYHVGNADKVLVLFESGTVEKVKAEDFLNDIGGQDATPNGAFWKIKP